MCNKEVRNKENMKKVNGIRVLVAVCLMKMLCVGFSGAAADHTDHMLAPVDTDITAITGDITGGNCSRAERTSTTTATPVAKERVHGVYGMHSFLLDNHLLQLPKTEQQVCFFVVCSQYSV